MNDNIFKPGDVVVLKTEGPHMVIEHVGSTSPNFWKCVWFVDNCVESAQFRFTSLKFADFNEQIARLSELK